MKILQGLKVEAIAIEVPDFLTVQNAAVFGTSIACRVKGFGWSADILPEGKWTILGRANELKALHGIVDDYGTTYRDYINTNNVYMSSSHSWKSYMEANNLTNELILIKI
jgi:hypothetical protein